MTSTPKQLLVATRRPAGRVMLVVARLACTRRRDGSQAAAGILSVAGNAVVGIVFQDNTSRPYQASINAGT
jgi:hypothetical protein